MNIGLIAGSYKPFTAGHLGLFEIASRENDVVKAYVSLKTRSRPGEMIVYEDDMREIWNNHILPILPENVTVEFVDIPIKAVYDEIGHASEEMSEDVYKIYSDPEDLASRFSEGSLMRYAPNVTVVPRPIARTETVDVSGTKMRRAIQDRDFEVFKSGMPKNIDVEEVWKILSRRAGDIAPVKKSSRKKHEESVLVDYVKLMIENSR